MKRNRPAVAVLTVLATAVMGPALGGCKSTGGPRVASVTSTAQPASSASKGPRPAADPRDRAVQLQRCMRDHGVQEALPNPNGGTAVSGGNDAQHSDGGVSASAKAEFRKAVEACRIYQPDGGEPMTFSPEDIEKFRQFSRCMREHGVPEWPDPDPQTGAIRNDVNDKNPNIPTADRACAHLAPAKTGKVGG